MTQEEKIKDLEQRLALVDADNSALATDLEHWKKVASGLKGRNKQLSERVKHLTALSLEGDGLYENSLAENENLKAQIAEKDKDVACKNEIISNKNKAIDGLESQVNELATKNKQLEREVGAMQDYIDECELVIQELQTPWWKKIF